MQSAKFTAGTPLNQKTPFREIARKQLHDKQCRAKEVKNVWMCTISQLTKPIKYL